VHVVDQLGAPLEDALVILGGLGGLTLRSRTDRSGAWLFEDVPPDDYTLTVVLDGFKRVSVPDVRAEHGCVSAVTVPLQLTDTMD